MCRKKKPKNRKEKLFFLNEQQQRKVPLNFEKSSKWLQVLHFIIRLIWHKWDENNFFLSAQFFFHLFKKERKNFQPINVTIFFHSSTLLNCFVLFNFNCTIRKKEKEWGWGRRWEGKYWKHYNANIKYEWANCEIK